MINHPPFRAPPMLKNPHAQTIVASYWPEWRKIGFDRTHMVELEDGDRLVMMENEPKGWQPGDRVVLLVHGLTGCFQSKYMKRACAALLQAGVKVFRLNMRGAGPGMGLAKKIYHSGRSEDTRAALCYLEDQFPDSPITAIGYSLGGNIILKMGGEPDLPKACDSFMAISPPLDLGLCSNRLNRLDNRGYMVYFVHRLIRHVRDLEAMYPEYGHTRFPRRPTLRQFDDLFTAPQGGFENALDYYQKASGRYFVPHIKVPTLILTSLDDPLIDPAPFLEIEQKPHLKVLLTEQGGHTGFFNRGFSRKNSWLDSLICQFVTEQKSSRSPKKESPPKR